jgi:hypothetical protein
VEHVLNSIIREARRLFPKGSVGEQQITHPLEDLALAPIREQLEGLIREWREATVGIGNYGTMRPLNEIEKAIARACADQLEALVGAVGEKKP